MERERKGLKCPALHAIWALYCEWWHDNPYEYQYIDWIKELEKLDTIDNLKQKPVKKMTEDQYKQKLAASIELFDNGHNKFAKSESFRIAVDLLAKGYSLYDVIDKMCQINEANNLRFKAFSEVDTRPIQLMPPPMPSESEIWQSAREMSFEDFSSYYKKLREIF